MKEQKERTFSQIFDLFIKNKIIIKNKYKKNKNQLRNRMEDSSLIN